MFVLLLGSLVMGCGLSTTSLYRQRNVRIAGKIEVRHLFPELYSELIKLLENLSIDKWSAPTSSSKWTVKDIVAHLVDSDLRRLSFQRDNFVPPIYGKQIGNDKELYGVPQKLELKKS